jgi:acetyl esterase/lipase
MQRVTRDIVYSLAAGFTAKLDVHGPCAGTARRPTLMFIHGGGWSAGYTKEMSSAVFLPFLQLDG